MTGAPPEFRALGRLEVCRDGRQLDLGLPRQRALLALLLDAAPRPVGVDSLVADLCPAARPRDGLHRIEAHVSSLRLVLGPDAVVAEGPAYRLAVPAERYDVARFEARADSVEVLAAAGDHQGIVVAAAAATAEWRGEAFEGLTHVARLAARSRALGARRQDVVAASVGARLALGDLATVEEALRAGRLGDATRQLALALPVLRENGQRHRLVECLDLLAWLAVCRGDAALAATLVAAADHLMALDGTVPGPADAALRAPHRSRSHGPRRGRRRRGRPDRGRARPRRCPRPRRVPAAAPPRRLTSGTVAWRA